MKRKLICNFIMILGAVIFAGTILFPPIIFINDDKSAFYALIIISVLMIIYAAWYKNTKPESIQLCGRDKVFLRALRTVNILAILVCFAFVVIMNFLTSYYPDVVLRNVYLLIIPATVSIFVAMLSLKVQPPIRLWNIAKSAFALFIAVALSIIYVNDIPKYSIEHGINILRSDEEFAQKDVFYPAFDSTRYHPVYQDMYVSNPVLNDSSLNDLFYHDFYLYYCDSYSFDEDGLHDIKGYIIFSPITGENEYIRTQVQDQVFGSREWPLFDWNIMRHRYGQKSAVLNLYFREWHPLSECFSGGWHLDISVSNGEWDSRLKDVLYPHNFPESEALSFLQSIGEEELKTKLLAQINEPSLECKDKTVEVYFFGIDIATYQNGEIVLKL